MTTHLIKRIAAPAGFLMVTIVSVGCGSTQNATPSGTTAVTAEATFCGVHTADEQALTAKYSTRTTSQDGTGLTADQFANADNKVDFHDFAGDTLSGLEREQPYAPPEIAAALATYVDTMKQIVHINADLENQTSGEPTQDQKVTAAAQINAAMASAKMAVDHYDAFVNDHCGPT